MELEDYPLFIPPMHLAEKGAKSWTRGEADEYSQWLQGSLKGRVSELLSRLAICGDDATEVLNAAGEKVAKAIRQAPFSSQQRLTHRGRALAADMGLLTATFLLRDSEQLRWEVVRRPKSDMSYNMPVLVGFNHNLPLDPVGGSIAEAAGLLRGNRGADAWTRTYSWWMERA